MPPVCEAPTLKKSRWRQKVKASVSARDRALTEWQQLDGPSLATAKGKVGSRGYRIYSRAYSMSYVYMHIYIYTYIHRTYIYVYLYT